MAEHGEVSSALAEQGDVMSVVVKQRQGAVGGGMQRQSNVKIGKGKVVKRYVSIGIVLLRNGMET